MKKAVLVEYSIVTRVIVDDDGLSLEELANEALDNQAIVKASAKILADAGNYVMGDNVVEIEDDEECPYDKETDKRETIGWQPAPEEFPLAGLQTFEVYQDLVMGKECHPDVKEWIEIFDGDIEKPVIIPLMEEVANNHIEILNHDISYYFEDDSEMEFGDDGFEHIIDMICQDYSEGELIKTDPKDEKNTIRGYWSIVRK